MINVVEFPGLGLSFELNRVAFSIGNHSIYWYGVIIAMGFLLAVSFCSRIAYRFGIDKEKILDMLFFAVPLSIIGGRAYYVIFYLDLYTRGDGSIDWAKAIAVWDGGIAIYGAIIMAVATVAVFCKINKINTLAFLDMGCYGLLIGQSIGRWGNFVNVEVYGGVTDVPWRMTAERIANTLWNQGLLESMEVYEKVLSGELGVHPTFIYESAWNALGLVLLYIMGRKLRKVDGQIFLSYVIWYGLGRAVIEGIRTDSLYFFNTGIRVSQMLGLVSALVAGIWLIWRLKHAGPAAGPFVAAAVGEEKDDKEATEHGGDQD